MRAVPEVYAVFQVEKKLPGWYLIIRKGDTDVHLGDTADRIKAEFEEREVNQGC
jgi:hypothetical protein